MKLENELKIHFQSDERMIKLKAAQLRSHYERICEMEVKSKARNNQILKDFQRVEDDIKKMSVQTDRLRIAKQQCEEMLDRKYPNWRGRALQKLPEYQQTTTEHPTQNMTATTVNTSPETTSVHHQSPTNQGTSSVEHSPQHIHQHSAVEEIYSSVYQNIPAAETIQKQISVESKSNPSSPVKMQSVNAGSPTPQPVSHQSPVHQQTGQSLQEVEDQIIQPVQDIPKHQSPIKTTGPMNPGLDDSDIDSDLDLPLSATANVSPQQKSPIKEKGDNTGLQGTTDAIASIETEVMSSSARSGSMTLRAELSLAGIMYLLKYVQDDIKNTPSEGYYKMGHPNSFHRAQIIQRANKGENLESFKANEVSMVILEQLTLVVRNLPDTGLLKDQMLMVDTSKLTEITIGDQLSSEGCDLWDGLFNHFSLLVQHKVMEPKEVAAIFVPGLVADGSQCQQKAFSLLVRLLEKYHKDDVTDVSSAASPQQLSPAKVTPRSPEKVSVPPLKFGSLIDRPFSDDESTSIFSNTTSRNPAVPLNETEAYKNLLSGTKSAVGNHRNNDDDDDTDDDVEKQFASVLSPRTPKQSVLSPRLNPGGTTGSLPSARSSKESAVGSIGSYQPPKRTGINIGSDLDSDTDIDLKPNKRNTVRTDEEDEFDFYS